VEIDNSRPVHIGRLLQGQTRQQALFLIPKLFLLCAQAQQAAAFGALAKAQGQSLDEQQRQHLAERCALEWLKEHCWQLWQMQRELFGPKFALQQQLTLSRALLQINQTLPPVAEQPAVSQNALDNLGKTPQLMQPLLGCTVEQFLAMDWPALELWISQPEPYPHHLASVLAADVAALGADPGWEPEQESGCLSRQYHHPLIQQALARWGSGLATRLLARLIEICRVCQQPLTAMPVADGTALASRGEVIHTATLNPQGLITEYQIDAPTDRYFSPQGSVERALIGQQTDRHNLNWIRQLIWAIDPCVEFTVHIKE
jgi:hypothetical protein